MKKIRKLTINTIILLSSIVAAILFTFTVTYTLMHIFTLLGEIISFDVMNFVFIVAIIISFEGVVFIVSRYLLDLMQNHPEKSEDKEKVKSRAISYTIVAPVILFCGGCFYSIYSTVAFPSPAPFPDAAVKIAFKESGHGGYNTTTYQYTVEQPLDVIEKHYTAEMNQYCVRGWKFRDVTNTNQRKYLRCRTADCEIYRPLVTLVREAQFFAVHLCSVSETETNVTYVEKEDDLS